MGESAVFLEAMMKTQKKDLPLSSNQALAEAGRYFKNAKGILKKIPIEYGIYTDSKYVKEAAAMGYLSALRAIDSYLLKDGVKPDKLPTSIQEYAKALKKIPHNGKLMTAFRVVYENLHILAYYRSGVDVDMVKSGFKRAKEIIDTFSNGRNIIKQERR